MALPYSCCKICQGAKAELHEIRMYVQQVTIDKQFIKVLLTKAVHYVYICACINTYVYTYVKAFIKEKKN